VAPTLVLAGADDRLIPPTHTLSLAREIANARTATLPGIGHVGTLQAPDVVAREVIAFLKARSGGNDHEDAGEGLRQAS